MDEETAQKLAIFGALTLYLDFINLVLSLLRDLRRRSGCPSQLRRPPDAAGRRRSPRAGTITERTTNVSSSTPKATMKPICVRTTSGSTASAPNVPASTMPAPVITAPVTASPRSVPSRVPCLLRLLAHPRHQEDVVVDPERDQEDEASSGSVGSTPAKPKMWSETKMPIPSAAAKDRITETISSSGATTARSSTIRITNTTSRVSGMISWLSRVAETAQVVLLRGRAADERVRAARLL